ncbi:hypothetical protein [Parabacteroides sp.]|uniref:hypothetical protein n=1 Tax=Parabacteroides sp. TaxID=1869337 RepID=UPI00283EEC7D|nr:hypothetical protein [Parabacteroides sp.]MDR3858476.1 hypothetical protein [Parabacteroides sp.]
MSEKEKTVIVQTEPVYTLRALAGKDVFPMVNIISKIGINEFIKAFESDEIKQLVAAITSTEEEDNDKDNDKLTLVGISVALDIANTILGHIGSCEREIYTFLSGLSGMKREELEELPINTFLGMIVDVFKKEEFRGFIGVVSKFIK